jgi:hypothetical protein
MKTKKGQVWISAVLYILIAAVAMFLILQMGVPLLNQMRDRSSYTRTKDVMVGLDKNVQDVAAEGEGSQRIIPVEVRQGEIVVDNTSQALKWTLETNSKVIEPRTSVEFGNVKIYTNIDVDAFEAKCTGSTDDCYILENSRIRAEFKKVESTTPPTSTDTSELIQSITFKTSGAQNTIKGIFTFTIGTKSTDGLGYTEMVPAGNNTNIDKASVLLHMTEPKDGSDPYTLILTLESESDFLKADVKNY